MRCPKPEKEKCLAELHWGKIFKQDWTRSMDICWGLQNISYVEVVFSILYQYLYCGSIFFLCNDCGIEHKSGKVVLREEDSGGILSRKPLKIPSKHIANHQGNDFIDTEIVVSTSLDTIFMDIKTRSKELNTSYEYKSTRGKRQLKK